MSNFAEIPEKSSSDRRNDTTPSDWYLYNENPYNSIGFSPSYKNSPSCKFGSPKIEDISKLELDDLLLTNEWKRSEVDGPLTTSILSDWKTKEKTNKELINPFIQITLADKIFVLPTKLKKIADEIEYSKYILALPDNWNDEGAVAIPEEILVRAVTLLINYTKCIFERLSVIIEAPVISPLPDGSIDLKWKTTKARLLINVKNTEKMEAHYYGDFFKNGNSIKGNIDTSEIQDFFAHWMANLVN